MKPIQKPSPFKVQASYVDWSCPWYSIRKDELLLPNGNAATYNVVTKADCVFVVPITADGQIVLINQYRHTTQCWCWEIPAGSIPSGKMALQAAEIELKEEVGGTAEQFEYLGEFFASNGICDEVTHLFLAKNVVLGESETEPLEILEVHTFPVIEALRMAKAGEIQDGISAFALLLAAEKL